jgi:hypothetical protein
MLAYLLLALLLPLQGLAGACAQICAVANAVPHEMPASMDATGHEDCEKSDIGTGKCCQGHVYLAVPLATPAVGEAPARERATLAPRWVSFIPEEPSPPPIARPDAA